MPSSFYEAVLQGMAGDLAGRRSLFLFVVEHSEAMMRSFGSSGQPRLAVVHEQLGEMVHEMARVDTSGHLDVGLVGYGVAECGGVASLWDTDDSQGGGFVRRLSDLGPPGSRPPVRSPAISSQVNGYAKTAMQAVGETVQDWKARNLDPIFDPVVLHVTAGDGDGRGRIADAVQSRSADSGLYFFNCCVVDDCSNSVVVPDASEVPVGFCRDLHAASSDMPPLMEDVGALLRGQITSRMRESATALARRHGLPGIVGSLGADLLGGAFKRGRLSVPTGLFASRQLSIAVEGVSIDSCRGFVLVRDKAGFRIFTRLCN